MKKFEIKNEGLKELCEIAKLGLSLALGTAAIIVEIPARIVGMIADGLMWASMKLSEDKLEDETLVMTKEEIDSHINETADL